MKTIKSILIEQLNQNKADLKSHEDLKALLAPYNGKPYDKRLENKLPAGYKLVIQYGLINITSPTGQRHFLGWTNNSDTSHVNTLKFDGTDSAYCEGAKDRISQLEAFLNNPERFKQMTSLYMKINKAWKSFSNAAKELEFSKMESFHNPAYYELLRNFQIPYRIVSDIRFNKINLD